MDRFVTTSYFLKAACWGDHALANGATDEALEPKSSGLVLVQPQRKLTITCRLKPSSVNGRIADVIRAFYQRPFWPTSGLIPAAIGGTSAKADNEVRHSRRPLSAADCRH